MFTRCLHTLIDLSVGVLHVAAFRSGFDAYNQTTNENRQKDTFEMLGRAPAPSAGTG